MQRANTEGSIAETGNNASFNIEAVFDLDGRPSQ